MNLPRLVIDTNVFVSGIITPQGSPGKILWALEQKKFIFVSSPHIAEEVLRILDSSKIRKAFPHVDDLLMEAVTEILLFQSDIVSPVERLQLSKDDADNRILEAAVEGNADAIVTGDKADLLILKEVKGIPIISPKVCLDKFKLSAA